MMRFKRQRQGYLQSIELLLILPVLILILVALGEAALVLSAQARVKEASRAATRVATLPATTTSSHDRAIQAEVERVLGHEDYIEAAEVVINRGSNSGDPVSVEVKMPMLAASPDMLASFGFSLRQRQLVARTVMRRE